MHNSDKVVDISKYRTKDVHNTSHFGKAGDRIRVLGIAVDICRTIDLSKKPVSDSKVREQREIVKQESTQSLIDAVMNSNRQNWLAKTELYYALASELKDRILEDR